MQVLQKAFFYLKAEGLSKTLTRTVNWLVGKATRLPTRWRERIFSKRYVAQIAAGVAGRDVYVLSYAFDWSTPLFQRPHQLAMALSRRENAHVIFLSDQFRFDNFAGILPVNDHLDVVPFRFLLQHPRLLQGAAQVTVFKSLPIQLELLERIEYDTLIYDYIDDLSLLPCSTEETMVLHHWLIQQANLTVCTARVLYEDACRYTDRAIFSPNAGDYALFHGGYQKPDPTLAQRTRRFDCVLGYYGCIANWLDYELLTWVAAERPNWCFVLIGQCFDGSDQRLRDANQDNLILWPAQPYRDLPRFTALFDIQTIPFQINAITQGTSPVKLFEYMAAGKPILTSNMPECTRYRSVTIYKTAEEFIQKVEQLRVLPVDGEYFAVMDQEARENTWDARVDEIIAYLKEKE